MSEGKNGQNMPLFYKFHTYSNGYWDPIGSGYEDFEECAESAWSLWGGRQPDDTVVGWGVEEIPDDGGPSRFHPVPGLPFVHPTKFHYLDKDGPMPAPAVMIPRDE